MKKVIISIMILVMMTTSVFAQEALVLNYDGSDIESDVAAYEENGETFIPFRAALEAIGFDVSYNAENDSAYAVDAHGHTTIEVMLSSKKIMINDEITDVNFTLVNSRTMVSTSIFEAITEYDITVDGNTLIVSEAYIPSEEFVINQIGDIKVHTYVSADPMNDASSIIESENSLVVIDLQAFAGKQETFENYVASLGKPVESIIITFHMFATGNTSIETDTILIDEVLGNYISENGESMGAQFGGMFGESLNTSLTDDFEFITEDIITIDGVTYEFEHVPAEGISTAGTSIVINDTIMYNHGITDITTGYDLYIGTHEPPVNTSETPMTEKITINEVDGIKVHSFLSNDPMHDVSHIIESDNILVAIDLQGFEGHKETFENYAASLEKPVDSIIIGFHGFASGTTTIDTETIYIGEELGNYLYENGDAMGAQFAEMFGDSLDTSLSDSFTFVEDKLTIDGITYEFEHVPAQGQVTAGSNIVINGVIKYAHDFEEVTEDYELYLGTHQPTVGHTH